MEASSPNFYSHARREANHEENFPILLYVELMLRVLYLYHHHHHPLFFVVLRSRKDETLYSSCPRVRECIQKFPDRFDNEIYAYKSKRSLRSNTKELRRQTSLDWLTK